MRARRSSRWICANSTARRANVTAFFLHVLPRLRRGVMVHLHDMPCRAALPIFTDEDSKRRPAQWPRRPHASMRATIAPISRDDSLSFLQASGRAPRQAARCFHATRKHAALEVCWPRVVLTEKRRALRTPIPNSWITAKDSRPITSSAGLNEEPRRSNRGSVQSLDRSSRRYSFNRAARRYGQRDRAQPRAVVAAVQPHTPIGVHCSSPGLAQRVRIHTHTLALRRGAVCTRS
jgi:hypothetical protein